MRAVVGLTCGPTGCGSRHSCLVVRGQRKLEKVLGRFLFKKAGHRPLDAWQVRAYKAGHDETQSDHYSNYMPGALRQSSCRDKAYEQSRRCTPQFPDQ